MQTLVESAMQTAYISCNWKQIVDNRLVLNLNMGHADLRVMSWHTNHFTYIYIYINIYYYIDVWCMCACMYVTTSKVLYCFLQHSRCNILKIAIFVREVLLPFTPINPNCHPYDSNSYLHFSFVSFSYSRRCEASEMRLTPCRRRGFSMVFSIKFLSAQ